jgi:hypothetical protein
MISRRFLLGAAPAALVAHSLPAIAKPIAISTWGAGTAALDAQFSLTMLLQHGLTTVGEVRAELGLPAFDPAHLLRAAP